MPLNQKGSLSPERLAARLARDHRGLADEVASGRMSLRTAAREAGLIKPRDPFDELVRWWRRADEGRRSRFLKLKRMVPKLRHV